MTTTRRYKTCREEEDSKMVPIIITEIIYNGKGWNIYAIEESNPKYDHNKGIVYSEQFNLLGEGGLEEDLSVSEKINLPYPIRTRRMENRIINNISYLQYPLETQSGGYLSLYKKGDNFCVDYNDENIFKKYNPSRKQLFLKRFPENTTLTVRCGSLETPDINTLFVDETGYPYVYWNGLHISTFPPIVYLTVPNLYLEDVKKRLLEKGYIIL